MMAKKKVVKQSKAIKDSMKLNEIIKSKTKYDDAPKVVADRPAPRSSNDILKELMKNG